MEWSLHHSLRLLFTFPLCKFAKRQNSWSLICVCWQTIGPRAKLQNSCQLMLVFISLLPILERMTQSFSDFCLVFFFFALVYSSLIKKYMHFKHPTSFFMYSKIVFFLLSYLFVYRAWDIKSPDWQRNMETISWYSCCIKFIISSTQ